LLLARLSASLSADVKRHMSRAATSGFAARALPWLLCLYFGASVLHFVHNAEYLTDYPNLPVWISRASIYFTWCVIFAIGLCGYLLFRRSHILVGLTLLAIYTALGFDGLLHYGRASMSAHTLGMNLTIWAEVVTAALALGAVLRIAASRFAQRLNASNV